MRRILERRNTVIDPKPIQDNDIFSRWQKTDWLQKLFWSRSMPWVRMGLSWTSMAQTIGCQDLLDIDCMLLHVYIVCGGICFMKQSQSFSDWNSEQYTKFGTQRTQPIIDLLNRIQKESPEKILDIGCGLGNSTEMLSRFFQRLTFSGLTHLNPCWIMP